MQQKLLCPQIELSQFRSFSVSNPIDTDFFKNKKILIIRPDRLWDVMVSWPFVWWLSKLSWKIYRWVDKKYWLLVGKFLTLFQIPNVELINWQVYNRYKFFSYKYEKHSKFLRFKLGIEYILSWDFFRFTKRFADFDIIFDLVWRRRWQVSMYLAKKVFGTKHLSAIDRTLTYKLMDSMLFRWTNSNISEQFLNFIKNADVEKIKKQYLESLNAIKQTKDYILIHLWYGGEKSRNWWYENWKKLIDKLKNKFKIKVVYTDGEKDIWKVLQKDFIWEVDFFVNPSLEKFFDIVLAAKIFIWIDSWPFHLADMLWKKWVVIFSRENERFRGPFLDKIKVIKKYDWICLRRNCDYDFCIKLVKVEDVLEALDL